MFSYVSRRTDESVLEVETVLNGKACRINPKRIEPMKTKLAATCLMAGLMLVPVAGYTADSAPTTYVKDSVITTKVKTDLAAEKMDSLIHIGVDTTDKGEVVLTGTVKTKAASDKATSITRAVKGVTSVDNRIKVVAEK
jgi:hyperosmotically inducible protein